MIASDKETRARERERDAQVGLPARRAAAELLSAVLQKRQALDDLLGRSLEKGAMFNLTGRDRALTRAIVATSLRRKGQLDRRPPCRQADLSVRRARFTPRLFVGGDHGEE